MTEKRYRIDVLDTGGHFFCSEDTSVLEAMRQKRHGPIHYGCFGGGCGVCKMKIVSGQYFIEKRMSHAHISEAEQRDGIVLICCVKPRGDLTIARAKNNE